MSPLQCFYKLNSFFYINTTLGPASGPTCSKILAPPLPGGAPTGGEVWEGYFLNLQVKMHGVMHFYCELYTCGHKPDSIFDFGAL